MGRADNEQTMNRLAKAALLMLSGTVALVVLARVSEPSAREFQPELLASAAPTKQPEQARVWKSVEWHRVGAIDSMDSGIIPLSIASSGIDSVVVLDAADYSLKRLRLPDLEVVSRTAIAPGAIRTVSVPILGMTAWGDHVWISSPGGQVVRINLRSGDYRVIPTSAYKIAWAVDALVLVLPPDRDDVLAIIRTNGDLVKEFGRFLEDQAQVGIALDGDLAIHRTRRHIFFAPKYGGFIASYDSAGNRRFLVESVDPSPISRLREDRWGVHLIPQPRESRLMALAAFEDILCVLVRVPRSGSEQERVVDVYQVETGAYLYSLRIPGRPSRFLIESGVLVAANTEGITAWELSAQGFKLGAVSEQVDVDGSAAFETMGRETRSEGDEQGVEGWRGVGSVERPMNSP